MTEKQTEEITIEDGLQELDKIVERLESRDISLEDSFAMYQKGMEVLKQCSRKIDMVEKKMLQMNKDGDLSEFKTELKERTNLQRLLLRNFFLQSKAFQNEWQRL